MIVEKRKKSRFDLTKRKKASLVLILVVSGFFIPYAGFFLYSMENYNSYAYDLEPPNPQKFVKEDASLMAAMAMWVEENIVNHHLPNGQIVNTVFETSEDPSRGNDEPQRYTVTYDSCEWTGHYLMGEAYRHAVHLREGRSQLAADALENIKLVLEGIDLRLHVSGNGGMARFAWPVDEYPGDPDNLQDDNHYRGSWKGQEYVFEDDTSRDMHNGIIMGLGIAYLLVDDSSIRDQIRTLVEFMLDYFLDNGWLYMKPTDDPNGTDLDAGFWLFGTSGIWTLAYLKVGALVNPGKYQAIYEHHASERDYVHRSAIPYMSRTNVVQAYYGLLLDWEVLYVLIMLEQDEGLKRVYLDYIGQIREYTKNDRNAQFNAMWLIMNGFSEKSASQQETFIRNDLVDCLMRYHGAPQRIPGRNINITNDEVKSEQSQSWLDFYEKGLGSKLYPFYREIYQFEVVAERALTPDLRPQTDYLWSRPPYWFEAKNQDGRHEGPSVDYVAVYWPCRYYGLISEPDGYGAEIEITYPGDS